MAPGQIPPKAIATESVPEAPDGIVDLRSNSTAKISYSEMTIQYC
jgi:hypothetical protein